MANYKYDTEGLNEESTKQIKIVSPADIYLTMGVMSVSLISLLDGAFDSSMDKELKDKMISHTKENLIGAMRTLKRITDEDSEDPEETLDIIMVKRVSMYTQKAIDMCKKELGRES